MGSYVDKNEAGEVIARYAAQQYDGQEYDADHEVDYRPPRPPLTPEQKLEAAGLTVDDLKELLK